MTGDEIEVCPACDSSAITSRSRSDHDFYCNDCGNMFDDPVVRESNSTGGWSPEALLERAAKSEGSP
ncbi:hypothetical protein [Natronoarchaeum philippinense]|uniref:hypothetical protein n=1 Tax=Natronoarchaeum philippinense TaxID=558529 RepID=UPI000BE3FF9D|nr:hypothetical protein [Natronoarchaeum philippinense]